MGVIFRDDYDDQQDSLMKSIAIGNTWQYRIFKVKAYLTALSLVPLQLAQRSPDYLIYKSTDSAGLISWLLG